MKRVAWAGLWAVAAWAVARIFTDPRRRSFRDQFEGGLG